MVKEVLRGLVYQLFLLAKALAVPVAFGAAGAVYDAQGRVLLVRHTYMDGWRLPGGGVGRGEAAAAAVLRELKEEVGLSGGVAEFFALYSRRGGFVTNVVALYRVTGAAIAFTPNLEISAILFADPHDPPPGCAPVTLRRMAELCGAPPDPYW